MPKYLLFVLALCISGTALADKDASLATYAKGKREYNLGNFAEAIVAFKAAYKEYEAPAYLYNIAQSYRQLKNCKDALFFYQRYLTEDPNSKQASVIRGYVKELTAECGSPDSPPETTTETKDAVPEEKLVPFAYDYVAEAQNFSAAGQFLKAAQAYSNAYQVSRDSTHVYLQAESMRLAKQYVEAIGAYDLYLEIDPTGTHASLAQRRRSELELAATGAAPHTTTKDTSSWSNRKTLALGLGAVGLVGMGVGGVFGLQAMGFRDDAQDPGIGGCGDDFQMCNPTGVRRYEDAQAAATKSNIAFGVGAVAAAAAVTLWLTAPSKQAEGTTRVQLAPALQSDSLGFVLSGDY